MLRNTKVIATKEATAKAGLIQQAKHMKRDTDAKSCPPNVGATVQVQGLNVNFAKLDSQLVLAQVVQALDNGLYKLDTHSYTLTGSEFTICVENFIEKSDVPDKTISLHSAAAQQSIEAAGQWTRLSML